MLLVVDDTSFPARRASRRCPWAHFRLELLERRIHASVTAVGSGAIGLPIQVSPPIGLPIHISPIGLPNRFSPIFYSPIVYGSNPALAVAPDQSLWLVESDGTAIGHADANGTVSDVVLNDSSGNKINYFANALAVDSTRDVWFAPNEQTPSLGRYDPVDGSETFVALPAHSSVSQLAAGSNGDVWFAAGGNVIGHASADGKVTTTTVSEAQWIGSLSVGGDGTVWFSGNDGSGHDVVGHLTGKDNSGEESTVATATDYSIVPIAAANDGSAFVVEQSGIFQVKADLSSIRLAGNTGNLSDPTIGPDGQLWLIDNSATSANGLERINISDGTVDHVSTGQSPPGVAALATAGGMLWFIDSPLALESTRATLGHIAPVDGLLATGQRLNLDFGDGSSQVYASFTDAGSAGSASDYTAVLKFDDGTTADGNIVANASGGFDVTAAKAESWGWHAVQITVTDTRSAGRQVAASSLVYVVPPPIAGQGVVINPVAGQMFNGVVATYTGVDTTSISRYWANVSWGDIDYVNDPADQISLHVVSPGVVQVMASHTYAKFGTFDIHVTLNEDIGDNPWGGGGYPINYLPVMGIPAGTMPTMQPYTPFNDAHSRADVAQGELDGTVLTPDIVEGMAPTSPLADFTSPTPIADADLSHFSATVLLLEDGSARQVAGVIASDGNGGLTVSIDSPVLYLNTQVIVKVLDDRAAGAAVGYISGWLTVQSHLNVTAIPFTATAGQEFSGVVGHISANESGTGWTDTFTATIDWGDGQTSDGTVVANKRGGYDVLGTHTYAAVQYHQHLDISVSVNEQRQSSDASIPTAQYSAGDSTQDQECHILPASLQRWAMQPFDGGGDWIDIGQSFSQFAAQITPSDAGGAPSDFNGKVLWDDGTTTPSTFALATTVDDGSDFADPGVIDVSMTGSFATAGQHTGTLTVTAFGLTQSVDVSVYISPPAVPWQPPPVVAPIGDVALTPVVAFKNELFDSVLGTFTPADGTKFDPATAKVTISWGDGPLDTGTLVDNGDGTYSIRGSHTFEYTYNGDADGEWDSVQVTISDAAGSAWGDTTKSVTVDPTRIDLSGVSDDWFSRKEFREREPFTTTLATFTPAQGDASATADQYSATIDWGDGTISTGVISPHDGGGFDVNGTHTYEVDGQQRPKITVTGPGGPMSTHASLWLDHNPVVLTPSDGMKVQGGTVSGPIVDFSDLDGVAADPSTSRVYHAALIDWGDGTVTQGVIALSPDATGAPTDVSIVSGQHTYAADGDYQITVTVRRNQRDLPASRGYRYNWYGGDVALVAAGTSVTPQSTAFDYQLKRMVHIGDVASAPPLPIAPPPALPAAPVSAASHQPALGLADDGQFALKDDGDVLI
jgi:hypothetical protein